MQHFLVSLNPANDDFGDKLEIRAARSRKRVAT